MQAASRWLSRLVPAKRTSRLKDGVNPRLVRHSTAQGLLPPPQRPL
ncbi:hypothetical protein [Deinococcus murrayi]|nr:hypothetical protein [Deinococcus murrayi]